MWGHEASHHKLLPEHPRANDAIGQLALFFLMVPLSVFRKIHRFHHGANRRDHQTSALDCYVVPKGAGPLRRGWAHVLWFTGILGGGWFTHSLVSILLFLFLPVSMARKVSPAFQGWNVRLDALLASLRRHVAMIRLGSRHPTTLPQRITPELSEVLQRYPPIYVMTHFNHPKECTPEAAVALQRLADAGCVLSNQSVLLRGVNDDVSALTQMHEWLLAHRCRPYRLYHCDFSEGVSHFRVPLSRGLQMMAQLRGHTSGLSVPEYVVDLPGGRGKDPVGQGHHHEGTWTFMSFTGEPVVLYEDGLTYCAAQAD